LHPLHLTGHQWILCIQAADRWDAPSLKDLALQEISNAVPAARIAAVLRLGLSHLLQDALTDMCKEILIIEGLDLLPIDVLGAIIRAREVLCGKSDSERVTYAPTSAACQALKNLLLKT
jgi:hypothetical protein